jgi:hypothetical protein
MITHVVMRADRLVSAHHTLDDATRAQGAGTRVVAVGEWVADTVTAAQDAHDAGDGHWLLDLLREEASMEAAELDGMSPDWRDAQVAGYLRSRFAADTAEREINSPTPHCL